MIVDYKRRQDKLPSQLVKYISELFHVISNLCGVVPSLKLAKVTCLRFILSGFVTRCNRLRRDHTVHGDKLATVTFFK